jgi:hypothetical protein
MAIAKTTLPHLVTLIRPNGIIELLPLVVLAGGHMFILVGLVLAVLPVDKLSRRFRSPGVQREWKDWKVTAVSRYLQNRKRKK